MFKLMCQQLDYYKMINVIIFFLFLFLFFDILILLM